MRRYVMGFWLTVLPLFLFAVAHAAEVAVPKDLEPWRGWVMQGEEFRRCPFVASSTLHCLQFIVRPRAAA